MTADASFLIATLLRPEADCLDRDVAGIETQTTYIGAISTGSSESEGE
jgi:hypothetical protein